MDRANRQPLGAKKRGWGRKEKAGRTDPIVICTKDATARRLERRDYTPRRRRSTVRARNRSPASNRITVSCETSAAGTPAAARESPAVAETTALVIRETADPAAG